MNYKIVPLLASALALTALAVAKEARVSMPNSVRPELARSRMIGSPGSAEILHLAIGLQPRHARELQAFVNDVSNPRSPNYRRWMTPAQVGEAFGASPTDVSAVANFLRGNGIKVTLIAPNRMEILADATIAQAQAAFGTTIKSFFGIDPRGKLLTFVANTTPITIPSHLARTVLDVTGLETYAHGVPKQVLTPTQTRTLYNSAPSFAAGNQGQGRTVGISNFDGLRLTNIPLYITQYGLPVPAGGAGSNISIVTVGTPANTGFASAEGDLDIQMVLGTAPLATIIIYDTQYNNAGYVSLITREASDNLADVITESWGWQLMATQETSVHNQHLAMSAQGQTYMCASGDDGTNLAAPYTYPDYDPEVLMVGGTTETTDGSGNRQTAHAWNGSSGGWVNNSAAFNTLPAWQQGNGVPTGINRRLVPDIALQSSGSTGDASGGGSGAFYFYYQGGLQGGYWGTSFASPVFAGMLACLEQRLAANAQTPRLGRVMDLIYSQNGRPDVWLDITDGNNSNPQLPDGTQSVGHAGWDTITGWGAPDMDAFYNSLTARSVSGSVNLQNLAVSPSGYQVTLQFYQAGTSTLVDTKVATLDASGNFTVGSTAPTGSYDVYAKASHWLRRKMANVTMTTTGMTGLTLSLIDGDVDGNNAITVGDFIQLRAAFGSSTGDPTWNPNADLNGNGSVTVSDFTILRANFGLSGD